MSKHPLIWTLALSFVLSMPCRADDDDEPESDTAAKPAALVPPPSAGSLLGDIKLPAAPPPVVAASAPTPALAPAPVITEKPVTKINVTTTIDTKAFASIAPSTGSEIAILLWNDQFFPSKIKMKEGKTTRLLFASLNKKPGALIVEETSIQRWVAGSADENLNHATTPWDATRQMDANRITEIVLEPKSGSYHFHDAISGAAGDIMVEP